MNIWESVATLCLGVHAYRMSELVYVHVRENPIFSALFPFPTIF